jgi:hypothetical protein
MPPEHNQQHPRRPHYHRGRRGPDRRGERRPQQSQQQQTDTAGRDQLDVEQIMREIRSRISERQGVDLTVQQIQELAARRLEAILDPRTIKPSLMDELRRAAGLPADAVSPEPEGEQGFDESALYKSESGFLRFVRRLLNPLLKLLFNPTAIVEALNSQSQRAKALAARDAEQRRRQTEWNGLHFEILRRLVTDIARVEIDNQHLAHRVESLAARVDFNERRVRGFEHTQHQSQSRPSGRPDPPVVSSPAIVAAPREAPRDESPSTTEPASSEASTEGSRRRRRRRRGRRSGQPREIGGVPTTGLTGTLTVDQGAEGDDFGDDDATSEELTEESEASAIADQPTVSEFEPPAPRPEETPPVAAADRERVPLAPDSAPAPTIEESVEQPDPVPPERS